MFTFASQLVKASLVTGAAVAALTIGGGLGSASADPAAPATPTTTTAPAPPSPGKTPGTVHPNVSAGDCESGGGIVVWNPDGTGTCIGGFYGGLEVF